MIKDPLLKNVFFFSAVILGLTGLGITGFMFVEGWSFWDAMYMTIITMATVGYGEVHPLSFSGQLFASVLILISFGFFAFAITKLSTFLFDGTYQKKLRLLKVQRKINKMEGHVIICGYGRVGRQVAEDLVHYVQNVVVIESNFIDSVDVKAENMFFIQGDATVDAVLAKANIEKAAVLVTCLPKDVDNVYVVLTAKELNNTINIVSRASDESAIKKLKTAGAHHVIMPDSIGGAHMASLITNPDVIEFMEAIRVQGKFGINMESILCDSLPSNLMNKPISSLEIKQRSGATIIGIRTASGQFIINPDNNELIESGNSLIVLGTQEQIATLNNYLEN